MRKFWVVYEVGGRGVNKAMSGDSRSHVAAEIRRKHPSAEISAIREIGPGVAELRARKAGVRNGK